MQYVYMLRGGEQHYKIGVATNIKRRVGSIQSSNPIKIEVITTKLAEDAYAIEGQLHVKLQQMKANGGSEWFVLNDKQALDFAVLINDLPEVDIQNNIKILDIFKKQEIIQTRIERKLDVVTDLATSELARREAEEAEKTMRKLGAEENKTTKTREASDEELIAQAVEIIKEINRASTSLLQRKLRIGYGRAARLMDALEDAGVIGPLDGAKPRAVLLNSENGLQPSNEALNP